MKRVAQQPLDYGWIEGSDRFKELVATLYQHMTPANILQTNGATGANFLALFALIESGDHVVSMRPTYQQLYDLPKAFGAEVDFVELNQANWQLDLAVLKAKVKPETKMICLNNANNPTGTLFDQEQLQQIVAIAKEADAYILVDEVYAPLTEEGTFCSIVDCYEKELLPTFVKTYSTPGIRIGWTAASEELTEHFRKYRDYTMICGGVIADEIAIQVLENKEQIIARNKKIVAENLAIVKQWVDQEPKVELIVPHYVSTAFIKLKIQQRGLSILCGSIRRNWGLACSGNSFWGTRARPLRLLL